MCRVAQNELKNMIIYHTHRMRKFSGDYLAMTFFLLIFIGNVTNDFFCSLYDVKFRHTLYLIK